MPLVDRSKLSKADWAVMEAWLAIRLTDEVKRRVNARCRSYSKMAIGKMKELSFSPDDTFTAEVKFEVTVTYRDIMREFAINPSGATKP